jgi:hypothetical protein
MFAKRMAETGRDLHDVIRSAAGDMMNERVIGPSEQDAEARS